EASINKKMLSRAAERVLLADSSKFGKSGPFRVSGLQTLTHVISDAGLEADWAERLGSWGVSLERAKVG
ncbi:DeoR/GlpR transcriptional regulator, partial [Escherichia coli]|nr:DeoR/GlpR transcriptional regulator [Escherichia coli]